MIGGLVIMGSGTGHLYGAVERYDEDLYRRLRGQTTRGAGVTVSITRSF